MKLSFWRRVSAIFLAVLLAVSTPVLAVSETMDGAVAETAAPTEAPVETVAPEETEAPAELDETTDSPTPGTDETVTPAPDPSVTYKLTFNGNGAKLTTAIAGSYTSKTPYAAGTEVNLTTALDGKKFAMALSADYSTNYRQLGWNTAKDGSGTHYDMGATFVMPEGDTTLYAEWEGYEWLHWEAVLAEGGESITIHEGVTGKTEKTGESFKLFTGNSGNQYGKVPAAYYTPVVATAKAGYVFTGWYDGETLVSESSTLTTQDFRNLRALKFAESGAKLEARFEKLPTITYTDGVGGKAFADQVYYVTAGEATPAFNGEPTRANCEFTGWTPEVAETVTGDATYTATWKVLEPAAPSSSNSSNELFKFHCTTDSEAHVDQTYNWFGSYVKYNSDMSFDEARGVYTATANITNVQTLLSTGVKAPSKVWGTTHYHTDENGATVRTATIKLVWNPDAGLWEPDGEQLVNVWHATAPAAPTLAGLPRATKTSTAIRVQNSSVEFSASNTRDSVDSNVHYFQNLKEGTYEFSEVTKDENGDFWCTLKITDFAPYVANFNTRKSNPTPAFVIDTEKTTADFTWKLKYTGSKTDYKVDGTGWSIDSSSWASGETVRTGKLLYVDQFYTVTYTDGANGEAFADQVTKVKPNAATPAFNGTPTRTNYDFTGWTPEVAETVTDNVTYTATWTPSTKNKPSKLTTKQVDDMQIRAYAEGTEHFSSLNEMSSCSPSIHAKGVEYTIGDVVGNDVDGYTTTVTFHFKSGDKFEEAARGVFNTERGLGYYDDWEKWTGNWSYNFTDERPADQVLNLIYVTSVNPRTGKLTGSWRILKDGKPYDATNITSAVSIFIKVNLKLERTVTYTDGANGEAFADQTYTVRNGSATPAFNGTPTRTNYDFAGWTPEVAESVFEDTTYTATWTPSTKNKPTKKITATDVSKMGITAYAEGTEVLNSNKEMFSCMPTIRAKGVEYTIGDIVGNDVDGYTTTVTFHFKSGDQFETAARTVFNTDKHFTAISGWDNWIGNWSYSFNDERPAEQVLTLYWIPSTTGRGGSWQIPSKYTSSGYTSNISTAVGNIIKVNVKLERTVTYTDGVEGTVFADQSTTVRNGSDTPAFNGSLTREGYVFNGWTPEVAEKVYADVTYTATWAEDKNGNGVADDKDPHYTVTYTDGVEDEVVFEDETYADQLVGMPTPAFAGDTTRKGYVFKGWNPAVTDTVTDDVTYVAVWGVDKNNNGIDDADETHYTVTYTDGVEKKEIFADQVYEGLVVGEATPAFNGTPTRKGYKFGGWEPKVAETVTDNAVYTAKWIKIEDTDDVPKTGDFATAPAALLASSLTFLGLGVVLSIESRKAKKNNH